MSTPTTTTRSIPPSSAPVLEELELEQPKLVTAELLRDLAARRHVEVPIDELVERLRRHGWLLDLTTRGVWEFAPAARAGALGSGDPFIELRATLIRRPELPVSVAGESAAWLHGLSGRPPGRHVIAAPPKLELPPALKPFRAVRHLARLSPKTVDGLPVWRVATLLVQMAARPSSYRDWPNVGDWLTEAVARVDTDDVEGELQGQKRSGWARVAYLLDRGGRADWARDLLADAPRGTGPYYLGPRDRRGYFDARYDVIDSNLGAPAAATS
jgi:AbiEi antitoxin C-terminal domain